MLGALISIYLPTKYQITPTDIDVLGPQATQMTIFAHKRASYDPKRINQAHVESSYQHQFIVPHPK